MVTSVQVEIWLKDQTTKAYLESLSQASKEIDDTMNAGAFIDKHNNDLTCNNIHGALGEKRGYESASDPEGLMSYFNLVEYKEVAA
jgi:hypothetical protein